MIRKTHRRLPVLSRMQVIITGYIRRFVKKPQSGRIYVCTGLAVILTTSIYWSVLGARVQLSNADQLVDPYLFANWQTFHGATFSSAHTFLLKWPLFWLINVFGISATSVRLATVALSLLTVGGLVLLLHRIDRRPFIFGTVCLGLALAMLLVPPQPYMGGLLPVSFAMITTRNVEYLVFILALVFCIQAKQVRSWKFGAAIVLAVLLFASDQLFLTLSGGGALLALFVFALSKNWNLVQMASRWLLLTLVSAAGMVGLLGIVAVSGLTHITTATGVNPYAVGVSGANIVLAVVYGVGGVLTTSGANPAYDATVVRHIPKQAILRLLSYSGPAFIISLGSVLFGISAVGRVVWQQLRLRKKTTVKRISTATQLSTMLIASSVTSGAIFIATNHYYAVDARYLAISFFALAVTSVAYVRVARWKPELVIITGIVFLLGITFALPAASSTASSQQAAYASTNSKNDLIAQALSHHRVSTLLGDYWRVLPTKFASKGALNVTPLDTCTTQRQVLSSTTWQPDLNTHSFAYLLSLSPGLTDYPRCTLEQVTAMYGRPNASILVSGSLEKPLEQLLIYDHGIHTPAVSNNQTAATTDTTFPVPLVDVPIMNCIEPTVMNIVAHQDDDILFMNPDLQHDIDAGKCVRSVYLTAGDAGQDQYYWLNRQLGSEAAYATMFGLKDVLWIHRTIKLADGQFVTIDTPKGNAKLSLIFFNLPDGGIDGDGFAASQYESLAKLQAGTIPSLRAVDKQSAYTSSQLTTALTLLMDVYKPSVVRTQADVYSEEFRDHSDHMATGKFAADAASKYDTQQFGGAVSIPVAYYVGYPIHGYLPNISSTDLEHKQKTFFAYAKYDNSVCHSTEECADTPTYGSYLTRQYLEPPSTY